MSMDSVMGAQFMSSVSTCSSPRMQQQESDMASVRSEDETSSVAAESTAKVKLMCSYGGRIMPRPHDAQLRYVGGETRILVVSRSITFASLSAKLAKLCGGRSVFAKYKLPYEDLDALVSVICDEDLEAMLDEYDRLNARDAPSKLRLFLFPTSKMISPAAAASVVSAAASLIAPAGSGSAEQQFVDAINGEILQQQQQQQVVMNTSPDFLFGFDQHASDAGGGGGSTQSSGSTASMIMEADSATQSGLAPICTAAVPAAILEEQHLPLNLSSPYILENIPLQVQNQILPPKAPKDKKDKVKKDKDKFKGELPNSPDSSTSSPSKQELKAKLQQQQQQQQQLQIVLQSSSPFESDICKKSPPLQPAVLSTSTSIDESQFVEEVVETLKLEEQVEVVDKQQDEQGKLLQTRTGSPPVQPKEMSLNVFMEQHHKLEEALQKSKSASDQHSLAELPRKPGSLPSQEQQAPAAFVPQVAPPQQQLGVDYSQAQHVNVVHYPVTSAAAGLAPLPQVLPQVPQFIQAAAPILSYQHQHQQQQQAQPYYIENNMIYYLAPAAADQQYMQRPVMINEAGIPIQRAHSGPLPATAQQQQRVVQSSAPLQRQFSAAYVDQFQQLSVAPNRMVYYPVNVPVNPVNVPVNPVNVPVNPVNVPMMPRTMQPTSRFRDQAPAPAAPQQQQPQYVDFQRLQQPDLVAAMRQVPQEQLQQQQLGEINQGMRMVPQLTPQQQVLVRQHQEAAAAGNRVPGQ